MLYWLPNLHLLKLLIHSENWFPGNDVPASRVPVFHIEGVSSFGHESFLVIVLPQLTNSAAKLVQLQVTAFPTSALQRAEIKDYVTDVVSVINCRRVKSTGLEMGKKSKAWEKKSFFEDLTLFVVPKGEIWFLHYNVTQSKPKHILFLFKVFFTCSRSGQNYLSYE